MVRRKISNTVCRSNTVLYCIYLRAAKVFLTTKLTPRPLLGYLLFVALYGVITVVPGPSEAVTAQLHATATSIRVAAATLVVVQAAIWSIGLYAYTKFNAYAQAIKAAPDGKSIELLRIGLLFIALWGPVASSVSSVLSYLVSRHAITASSATVFNHYVGLLMPFTAYLFISFGARGLSRLAHLRPSLFAGNVLTLILVYIGVVFIRLVFTTPDRQLAYQESGWVVMLTLVAPYIFTWTIGAMAAYELYLYSRKSPGKVYRQLWRQLSLGFGWLIGGSILLQFVTVLMPRFQQMSSLGAVLLVVYALLALISVGFLLIGRGTASLQKIETT